LLHTCGRPTEKQTDGWTRTAIPTGFLKGEPIKTWQHVIHNRLQNILSCFCFQWKSRTL